MVPRIHKRRVWNSSSAFRSSASTEPPATLATMGELQALVPLCAAGVALAAALLSRAESRPGAG